MAIELFRKADRRPTSVIAYAECRAAVAAAARSQRLTRSEARKAVAALNDVWPALDRLAVSEEIVHRAGELAERRALRENVRVRGEAEVGVIDPQLTGLPIKRDLEEPTDVRCDFAPGEDAQLVGEQHRAVLCAGLCLPRTRVRCLHHQ